MKCSSTWPWVAGAIVAIVAGAHFLIIHPANLRRESLQRDIAQKRAALASFDRSAESFRVTETKINRLRPAIALFGSRFGSGRETNKMLEDLWHLAESNSLQAKSVKTPAEKRNDSFREQEIELSVTGHFSGYYQFLLQLEGLPRITRIKRMHVTKMNLPDGQVQAEMTLSVFFAPGSM